MKSILKVASGLCMLAILLTACGGSGDGGSETIPTYAVTYDGNGATGGSVPTDTTNYAQNHVVTVQGNPGNLVKTHYSFAGWNTASDGSGITYAQGQTFTMGTANVTLYANWTAKPTYTVTYDGNGSTGGIVPVDRTNYEETQTVTVIGNTGNLVKTHFAFASWNTAPDGSGVTYTQGATFQMGASNMILYAQWTANPTYMVTYDGNGATGGTPPVDTNNYEEGYTVTVLGNPGNLVKTHYSFAGWNTASNGSGITYAQGQTFTMGSASVTLYAKWTAKPTYTVTYDGNGSTGGIVPVDSTSYKEGQTVTVLGNTGSLVKNNYSFVGWNTQADGNGTDRAPSSAFKMGSANVTLYAKWMVSPRITQWPDNKKGGVSLTFDDGCPSQISLGIPALNERGLKGTFFLITDYVSAWDSWRDAANMGHEIGSHTKTHPFLTSLPLAQVQNEVTGSKTAIDAQVLNQKCVSFAYPYGDVNYNVESIVDDVYIGARGVICGLNSEPFDFYNVAACSLENGDDIYAQADAAAQQQKWLVVFFHSLNGGNDCWGTKVIGDLTNYLDYLQTKNLWVGTFGAMVKYIKERESATLSVVSSSSDQIVLSLTDILNDATYDQPLTIRSEVPSGWANVTVQQGAGITTVKSVVEGAATVVYYNATPDRGTITLKAGTAVGALTW